MGTTNVCPSCDSLLNIPESLIWKEIKCGNCGSIFIAEDTPRQAAKAFLRSNKLLEEMDNKEEPLRINESNLSSPNPYNSTEQHLTMHQAETHSNEKNEPSKVFFNLWIMTTVIAVVLGFMLFTVKKEKTRIVSNLTNEIDSLYQGLGRLESEKSKLSRDAAEAIEKAERIESTSEEVLSAMRRLLIKQGFTYQEAEQFIAANDNKRNKLIDDKTNKSLPTDNRLSNGTVLLNNSNPQYNNHLVVNNNGKKDAFVKLIKNGKAVASFYVRASAEYSYDGIPSGVYYIAFCTGYDWDSRLEDFNPNRYRVAQKFDSSFIYTNGKRWTIGLSRIPGGNAKTTEIPLSEFKNY